MFKEQNNKKNRRKDEKEKNKNVYNIQLCVMLNKMYQCTQSKLSVGFRLYRMVAVACKELKHVHFNAAIVDLIHNMHAYIHNYTFTLYNHTQITRKYQYLNTHTRIQQQQQP